MADFGDGATGSGRVVTHTYSSTGTYTAIVVNGSSDPEVGADGSFDYQILATGVAPAPDDGEPDDEGDEDGLDAGAIEEDAPELDLTVPMPTGRPWC